MVYLERKDREQEGEKKENTVCKYMIKSITKPCLKLTQESQSNLQGIPENRLPDGRGWSLYPLAADTWHPCPGACIGVSLGVLQVFLLGFRTTAVGS